MQFGNKLDTAFDEELTALVDPRAPVIRMFRLACRERAFWLWNPINILQLGKVLALLEVLQAAEGHCLDHRIHHSDSESY